MHSRARSPLLSTPRSTSSEISRNIFSASLISSAAPSTSSRFVSSGIRSVGLMTGVFVVGALRDLSGFVDECGASSVDGGALYGKRISDNESSATGGKGQLWFNHNKE